MSFTKESLANLINGREYRSEITDAEIRAAKAAGLVVIFGYSDDNIELRGAIDEEVGAYDGTTFTIDAKGLAPQWDEDGMSIKAARDYFEREGKGVKIEAKWDAEGYSWVIRADMPFAVFDIMEDGEKFCRGIVIDIRDLAKTPKPVAFEDGDASIRGGLKYTLAAAMEDAAAWISGATFHEESRGWRPAVALMREEIVRQREELYRAADWHKHLTGERDALTAKLTESERIIALAKEQFAAMKKRAEIAEAGLSVAENALSVTEGNIRSLKHNSGFGPDFWTPWLEVVQNARAAHPVSGDANTKGDAS